MNYQNLIHQYTKILEEFFTVKESLFEEFLNLTAESLKAGHKILVFGNGGSAAQAQHFAAELVNKFLKIRLPLKAISLTTDTSALTSISNDSSFEYVFSRQIEALGEKGDVAVALSTSGDSSNVIRAIEVAKRKELLTAGFTGKGGGQLSQLVDYLLDVPSESTPRIQEAHLLLLHLLAQELEERLG
ncbi:MAG: SIS domain-containing protein [Candidatus Aminicenantes bacterium]|nr:SIS domain-containing protein [Candidatus Aminicenantes bacterium]